MEKIRRFGFLQGDFWAGWRRWAAWAACISTIFLLGALRAATDAEFTFVSLAVLPVLAIAWIGGTRNGLYAACLAAGMWALGDITSEQHFNTPWIPWANAVTRLMTYCLVALLASQVRLQFEREHENATRDTLTGLHNRRAFFEAGAAEVELSKRYRQPLAVIFLDLDDFKQLNDSKGHDAGDAALRATASALTGTMRANDRLARLGGDEFAMLLPQIGYEAAIAAGQKISKAVDRALCDLPPVKGSLGVAWFGSADRPFPAMLKAADELMYEVKQCGKHDMRTRSFDATSMPEAERSAASSQA